MAISDINKESIENRLLEHTNHKFVTCPVCQTQIWGIGGYYELVPQNAPNNLGQTTAPSTTCVAFECSSCRYLRLHSIKVLANDVYLKDFNNE